MLQFLLKLDPGLAFEALKPRPSLVCPCCGANVIIVRTRIRPPLSKPESGGAPEVALAV
ncbi:transposase [Methylocaldum marinum]|uniref:Transposase n=1 Tax=Methylocaldum marinum TaxID=1432792 RepID=A0A250KLT9_9GAMM|nr:transposase [Methylocaldum marinum]